MKHFRRRQLLNVTPQSRILQCTYGQTHASERNPAWLSEKFLCPLSRSGWLFQRRVSQRRGSPPARSNITRKAQLSFIKGVLIHINPDHLQEVYEKLYNASEKFILVAEYYNPSPVAIPYRGHDDRLFKRDFAGELLEKYSDLELVDYGFAYRRDPAFPQDDITWFLMRKN
jgi:hypothetical protein